MARDSRLPELDEFAASLELAAIGVADLDDLRAREPAAMEQAPAEFSRGIALGVRLPDAVIDQIEGQPTPLYFHTYRQANFTLDRAAMTLALQLQQKGYRALPVPASQIVDKATWRGMMSHRLVAHAAGLGWIGRSRLLVNPEFGARMRYACVLTDAPYVAGRPLEADCGDCTRCLETCPAGGIKMSSRDFDLAACFKKLTEFQRLPFIGQHICGVCVKACRGTKCV